MSRVGGGPKSLGAFLPKLTQGAIARRGFAEAGLITDWDAIAGEAVAAHVVPERLEFPRGERMAGTLHLVVESAWAVALQHLEPQLIERINASLGYGAVARLKLRQGPLPRRARPSAPPSAEVDPEARAALADKTASIEDAGLRQAVERLGLAILSGPGRRGNG
ncbi:MAG TPA: DciA family protein [Alphaproteobacteria bacterium]|nr:DciA family protein [Alphaproteobacteria bacterium]